MDSNTAIVISLLIGTILALGLSILIGLAIGRRGARTGK